MNNNYLINGVYNMANRVVVPADRQAGRARAGQGGQARPVGRDTQGRKLVSVPKSGTARNKRVG